MIPQFLKPVEALAPAADAAGRTGDYISLKNVHCVFVVVHITQGNAATVALTLEQATDVSGTGSKAITVTVPIWANQDTATSDTNTRQTDAVSFTTSAAVKNKLIVFKVDPEFLDQANSFDCLTVKTGASNAANITQAMYYVSQRYAADPAPTSITD